MNLRLFCALPVPVAVQDELLATSNSLRNELFAPSVSWVKAGNFHLTLSFLGDVEDSRVDELAAHLRLACRDLSCFELECRGLGCFPTLSRPRVIWAGLRDAESQLSQLQKRVAAACAPFAQKREERFSGHITLGRVRQGSRIDLASAIERNRDTVFGTWTVSEVELVSSDLSQSAPRYSVLGRVLLEGATT